MSTEDNKALIRRIFEEENKGNAEGVLAYLAPDALLHFPGFPAVLRGHEGYRQQVAPFQEGFPGYHFTEEDMIAEGDTVVARWRIEATHSGEFQGIPATGKRLTVTSIDIFRIAGGKVAEQWTEFDALGMMQQLGAIPAPGQALTGP